MFFFLEDGSIPTFASLSEASGAGTTVAIYLQQDLYEVAVRAFGEKRKGSPQGNPLVTAGLAQI